MEKFYLTTAIAYTSAIPHIGNVYEAILADAICRFKRLEGYDVRFQTGTDEHGQKIQEKALARNLTPQAFADEIAGEIKRIYDRCNVSYDKFIRTTDKYHEKQVAKMYEKLYSQGDIYKGFYEGHYCVACESFFTETQLVDGKCPDCGGDVKLQKEEAYFLRLAKYQQRLIDHIKNNPDFIQPESRKNEMLNNFLKDPIPDLCVSRTTFNWGIPLPFDPKHVSYVWLDALSNYITGLGYDVDGNSHSDFMQYWPCDVHLIGKDILRFHTIYWPIMLMMLGIELPKKIFGHPWILMNKNKMSKSKGNVLYTDELIDLYGLDPVRYYVLHEIPYAQDGNLTHELLMERTNSDLANNLSNLLNRTMSMVNKYFGGIVNKNNAKTAFDDDLINQANRLLEETVKDMNELKVADAIERVMNLLSRANKYIDETAPWVLAKDESQKDVLENVMYNLLETLRFAAVLLQAFIPDTACEMFLQLNTDQKTFSSLHFGSVEKYKIGEQKVLFKRFDIKEMLEKIEKEEQEEVVEDLIEFDDFIKVKMVVGKIIDSKMHPDAKKLLVNQIDVGNGCVKQIVSGIASFYKPEDIIGKKVIVVTNLKPVKLRGVLSYGMVLCAGDKNLELIEIKDGNLGDEVR